MKNWERIVGIIFFVFVGDSVGKLVGDSVGNGSGQLLGGSLSNSARIPVRVLVGICAG